MKPKSIKNAGLVISVFSGFMIFSNGMGALAWSLLDVGDNLSNSNGEESSFLSFILEHYLQMCSIMVVLGTFYLVGGLFIMKYKLWANRLITILSCLVIVIIWGLMISLSNQIGKADGMSAFSIAAIFNALLWSAPIGFLIWFLNKKVIRKHFS